MARVRNGAFPIDLEMDYGYPSETRVREIELVAAVDAERWIRDALPGIWRAIPCTFLEEGATTDILDRPAVQIRLATGGWSGAEYVIHAVLRNRWLAAYCRERRSGGGYTFVVRAAAV